MKKYTLAVIPLMMLSFGQASLATNTLMRKKSTDRYIVQSDDGAGSQANKVSAKLYLEMGEDAVEEGDPQMALRYFKFAAEGGNAEAQFTMGKAYEGSFVVETDYSKAYQWYFKSSNQGNTKALAAIANMYAKGEGVKQSYEEAFDWYRKAAQLNDSSAQVKLGEMFMSGTGVTKNLSQAKYWFEKSAGQVNYDGILRLADMYYTGNGVSQNLSVAYALLLYCSWGFGKPELAKAEQVLARKMSAEEVGRGTELFEKMKNNKPVEDIRDYLMKKMG